MPEMETIFRRDSPTVMRIPDTVGRFPICRTCDIILSRGFFEDKMQDRRSMYDTTSFLGEGWDKNVIDSNIIFLRKFKKKNTLWS